MKKLNRQLTVYLSKSLLIPESKLRPIREMLIGLGLQIREYKAGTDYDSKLLEGSDFVLFIPMGNENEIKKTVNHNGRIDYAHFVGKGQFTEARLCEKIKKPAFMFHGLAWDDLSVSKLPDEFSGNLAHMHYDMNDWKKNYGILQSYTRSSSGTIPLFPFVEGYFGVQEISDCSGSMNAYPLTPSECYGENYQLLLL